MGKPTGFIEIARQTSLELPPEERIQKLGTVVTVSYTHHSAHERERHR